MFRDRRGERCRFYFAADYLDFLLKRAKNSSSFRFNQLRTSDDDEEPVAGRISVWLLSRGWFCGGKGEKSVVIIAFDRNLSIVDSRIWVQFKKNEKFQKKN